MFILLTLFICTLWECIWNIYVYVYVHVSHDVCTCICNPVDELCIFVPTASY